MIALVAGVLFGFGLAFSGMMQPEKVIGFLDITGNWDASLMLVMGGALAIFTPGYHFLVKGRSKAINGDAIQLPGKKSLDSELIIGALLFGAGWGLAGICPGPAIAMAPIVGWPAVGFIAAMSAGMWLAGCWMQKKSVASQAVKLATTQE